MDQHGLWTKLTQDLKQPSLNRLAHGLAIALPRVGHPSNIIRANERLRVARMMRKRSRNQSIIGKMIKAVNRRHQWGRIANHPPKPSPPGIDYGLFFRHLLSSKQLELFFSVG
jgi:hypothetical protein